MLDRTPDLRDLRETIRDHIRAPEGPLVARLTDAAGLTPQDREAIGRRAAELIRATRAKGNGPLEAMLSEYGLSTEEGVALMCLAEALLRVPDAPTVDALIADKLADGDWSAHLGRSGSALVEASSLGLALTGGVLRDGAGGLAATLRGAARRLGAPVIRTATLAAMREMGRQFVLGQDIAGGLKRAAKDEARGVLHSYDMLGEAAMTAGDAARFLDAYHAALDALIPHASGGDVRANPGISVKLSALHPRYEVAQEGRVMAQLVPRLSGLLRKAARHGIGLNVDAEEADRLDLSLSVIEAALRDPDLPAWEGFGVVVQAYSRRAGPVIDWLSALSRTLDRPLMVRLVKGAYWDAEIKRAQVEGLDGFPVFTRKPATDVSFIACARKLLAAPGLYPQIATHNAHTAAAVLHMAAAMGVERFEFQRLHGMGAALHDAIREAEGTALRVYAPVGPHRELLAYLVRRLLENGANASFVNRVADRAIPAEEVAPDPFAAAAEMRRDIAHPTQLFAPRRNARGWDLSDPVELAAIEATRAPWRRHAWGAGRAARQSPCDPADLVGRHDPAGAAEVAQALDGATPWAAPAGERARILRTAADAFEDAHGELFALLAREAGKTLPDCVAELREAVDFLRYYADGIADLTDPPLGTVAAIAPWNFPLAIFTGQVAAALAAGNAVIAKPAQETPLIAARAVELLRGAGVPKGALRLVAGGREAGAALTGDPRLDGVLFTGSTATAKVIDASLATHAPGAVLVAETGGINAMVVDSTALPEQAVRDILASAFQSAGQRCSALRCLYVQADVAEAVEGMLTGALAELRVGDPWDLSSDLGPVIHEDARAPLAEHIARAEAEGRLIARGTAPEGAAFLAPAILRVDGIADIGAERFGPILHVARFEAGQLDRVLGEVNATGYGLTFGLHTRITRRARDVPGRVRAGNVYVNRNQIGAIVGSQPFGGEGLSGTGPKAGGPLYLPRLTRARGSGGAAEGPAMDLATLQAALDAAPARGGAVETREMPGPTGERNTWSARPRGAVLCAGPGRAAAARQAARARASGCHAVEAPGGVEAEALAQAQGLAAVIWWGDPAPLRVALAGREGPILPLIADADPARACLLERHVCTDTTAAGGDAALLASA
ncbi:MAG: bifunctional proline dehydrogenase/L-glutamate gamma-semialdehyde dehydrogenase PutA [Paracoccaceae bacterium]